MLSGALTQAGFGEAAAVADQPTGFSVGATFIIGVGALALGALAGYMIRDSIREPADVVEYEEDEDR